MKHGTDFTIDDKGILDFVGDINTPRPSVRRFRDAANILYPYQRPEPKPDKSPLYYMYRGIYKGEEDRKLFKEHGIRHDITVLLPGFMGEEFIKTVGHFHPKKAGGDESYPEYYEVLHGEALYLLQKNTPDGDVEEVFIVTAKEGDTVYIDPNFGHITINPGKSHLVMANLVADDFNSNYKPIEDKKGAAYFYIRNNLGELEFVPNPNYKNSITLRLISSEKKSQPIDRKDGLGLYDTFLKNPQVFEFLK